MFNCSTPHIQHIQHIQLAAQLSVKALVYWGCKWWCTWRNSSPASSSRALHLQYTTGNLWVSWAWSVLGSKHPFFTEVPVIPSGKPTVCDIENGHRLIVDLPIKNEVDLPVVCCNRLPQGIIQLFKIQIPGGRVPPTSFDNETGVSTPGFPGFQRVFSEILFPGRNGKISHAEKYSLHLLTLSVYIHQYYTMICSWYYTMGF